MSRVDPVSVAVYTGGLRQREADADPAVTSNRRCPLIQGVNSYSYGAINLDCFRFPEDWPEAGQAARSQTNSTLRQAAADGAAQSRSPANRSDYVTQRPLLAYSRAATDRVARNRLISVLMKHSDDVCTVEMGRITANEATVNTTLSTVSSGLSIAATIVGGELASSILSGGAAWANASRDHVNVHIYRNQVSQAVSHAITFERTRLRGEIVARFADDISTWTIDQGIQSVNAYHGTCSFYKGLELVLAAVDNQAEMARLQASRSRQTDIANLQEAIRVQTRARDRATGDARAIAEAELAVLERRLAAALAPPPATRAAADASATGTSGAEENESTSTTVSTDE